MAKSLSNFKGYNTNVKGIVTRDITTDPQKKNRIQVCIPVYHGDVDQTLTGSGTDPGKYPWTQVCSTNYTTTSGGFFGIGATTNNTNVVYPSIGDKVWLSFEGGDIRCPVYVGSIPKPVPVGGNGAGYVGGDLASIACSVIFAEEGDYGSVNGNDNGAISVGRIQWHADRAKNLLAAIQKADASAFSNTLSSSGAGDLIDKLGMGTWKSFTVGSGTALINGIKAVCDSAPGHATQDAQCKSDVQGYLDAGTAAGITDPGALIFWADCMNQGGLGGAQAVLSASAQPVTLDDIYNGSLNTYMGNYKTRRQTVHDKIKSLADSGALNTTTDSSGGSSQGGKYLWPTNYTTNVTSPYGPRDGGFHYGIDISSSGITGKPAVAIGDGTVAYTCTAAGKTQGNCIGISLNGEPNTYAVYMHLCEDPASNPGLSVGTNVRAGQTVGFIGNTGASCGAHLHLGIHKGTMWPAGANKSDRVDPMPYLKG